MLMLGQTEGVKESWKGERKSKLVNDVKKCIRMMDENETYPGIIGINREIIKNENNRSVRKQSHQIAMKCNYYCLQHPPL